MLPEKNIRNSETLPGSYYLDSQIFEASKKLVFQKSWQWFAHTGEILSDTKVFPGILLEGFLDEPVILTFPETGSINALSNVCTHRGALLCNQMSESGRMTCRYHGRQFDLNGAFLNAPGFESAENFPRPCDNLGKLNHESWGGIHFVSSHPSIPFEDWIKPVRERMFFFPMNELITEPVLSRSYLVKAHWALYCDNYLEGFHIPFVHPGLNKTLDYGQYRDEIFQYGTLQTGIAKSGELCFDLPPESPDYGKDVAGYYFWLFPNLMLNFYPWGLSVNYIRPLKTDLTRVEYKIYVWKPELLGKGAGGDLDKVEREDEEIIESVQKGIKSSHYTTGRFSPEKEKGVHHFHRMLAQCLYDESGKLKT